MWKVLATIVMGGMLCSVSFSQNATPSQTQPATPGNLQTNAQQAQSSSAQPAPRLAAGSVIPVELTKSVDAKKVKTGDEVDVKVTQDMKAQNGQILMAKDTKIVGHVTEVQARTKEQKESQVGIAFDHAVLKEGGDVALPASIQAVIVPANQNPDNAAPTGGSSMPAPTGGTPTAGGARQGMTGSTPQAPSSYPRSSDQANNSTAGSSANPQITSKTEGVIGLSNYKLSTPGDVTQGSVVSSEKNNVKLESGTLMLLRVNQ